MFKVNNKNTRIRCEICSKLTTKTPERCQWGRSGVFIVNFEHISQLAVSIVNFEQVNANWVATKTFQSYKKYNLKVPENFHFNENKIPIFFSEP